MQTTLRTIQCSKCHESFEYEDDGATLECLPDGYIVATGEWVCLDCWDDSEEYPTDTGR